MPRLSSCQASDSTRHPSCPSYHQQRPPELVWSQPRCIGDAPSKRSGHSLTIVKSGVAYLFGGNPDEYG